MNMIYLNTLKFIFLKIDEIFFNKVRNFKTLILRHKTIFEFEKKNIETIVYICVFT